MGVSSATSTPDLIVGVDFGHTCTGVAYAFPQNSDTIRQVQQWPGAAQRNENKVPTMVLYSNESVAAWGFAAEARYNKPNVIVREWFKILLDGRTLQNRNAIQTEQQIKPEHVRYWYRDFLCSLYDHIKQTLQRELDNFDWSNARVEFLFSMPTTWRPEIVNSFREIIGQAGYGGAQGADHTVTMSLTEAEAAAVHTSTESASKFRTGDIVVVCDAGGGTTDLAALEVTELMVNTLSLDQVDVVEGANVGSAAIDENFQNVVQERLERANRHSHMGIDIDDTAWQMARSTDFQNVKCGFGGPNDTPQYAVTIPKLSSSYKDEATKIANGEMIFDKLELQAMFDLQIEKVFRLIDRQLKSLEGKKPGKQINHLILSGGMGQSPYVQQRLQSHYCRGAPYTNAQDIVVRVAPEPQMAVCKGLVADRMRKLRAGKSVLGWRCCRASYGLLCSERYTKKDPTHANREKIVDEASSHVLVQDCVQWLIKKGEPVRIDDPIKHSFKYFIKRGDNRKRFPNKVVVSYTDPDLLPRRLEAGLVEVLCEFEADLGLVDERKFVEKKKGIWQSGNPYLIVEFEVRVIIGPADLQFELWFEGQKMSKENSIKVEWASSTDPSAAALVPPERYEQVPVNSKPPKDEQRPMKRLFHRKSAVSVNRRP